jgi:hypothetical protein
VAVTIQGDINMCNLFRKYGHKWTTCDKCGEKIKVCAIHDTGEKKHYKVCGPCYVSFTEVVQNV